MSRSTKTCLLFTLTYPYGSSETFIEAEIKHLSAYFEKVIVFPLSTDNGELRQVPDNVSVELLFNEPASIKFGVSDVDLFLRVFLHEMKFQFKNMLSQFRFNASYLKTEYVKAKLAGQYFQSKFNDSDCVFYSYWFDTWSFMLSLVKVIYPGYKFEFYSRAHGFDVFKDQTRYGYHPFKNFMLSKIGSVYSVSETGRIYLQRHFPQWSNKLKLSYLGTESHAFSDKAGTTEFVIATCANVRSIKRIEFIPEILKFIPESVKMKWVLIGGGDMLDRVKESCRHLGSHIKCEFTGHLDPEKVHAYYSENRVDLFLSVSRSEGIPFTMMEAISYGIPLMSTNVGGCSEICNEHTGVLIEKDFQPKEVADKILAFSGSRMNTPEFRKGVRKFWEEHFNAEKNYEKFYKEISLS